MIKIMLSLIAGELVWKANHERILRRVTGMPENIKAAVEAFIDEVDLILFDRDPDLLKVKRIRELCADTRLAMMVEELS